LLLLIIIPGITDAQKEVIKDKCIPCEKLTELRLPDVKITEAEIVAEGSSYCKVLGIIGKEINFEILLPDDWNGIYLMGGGGGFVGTIQNAVRSSVENGYATSGTDTGHDAKISPGAGWALDNMERQLNFGYLAVHRTAEVSKAIIASYYGSGPEYSYFMGCSRGGGQAMMEAQRFPEDFDGIVAAAPAFNWPALAAEFIQNTRAAFPEKLTEPLFMPEHIRILHYAVLEQCDQIDGVKDSIISNPERCRFDFEVLPKCRNGKAGKECFTEVQINSLKKIYDGIDLGNGIAYPGFPFGGEGEAGGWTSWITGSGTAVTSTEYPSSQAYFGIEVFRYLILQNPDWDYTEYDFRGYDREMKYASSYLDATSDDYSGFRDRNGKIILWHGWNDPALSARATIDHYNAVKEKDPAVNSYMRLYLLPGVLHCGGGKGPSETDWITLIRDWVEKDIAPGKIIVRKSVSGRAMMSRPVFPYPAEAVYDGRGNPYRESSFTVRQP
ncbi:MAG TPA: tannase/feruloyl esterase family alpha/beta hydrolase, partial [Bacteroidales bacterium]|nr:tannase/feruloyl esterase family alpha/beta hydrolase [Bacteroidales bacterium]